MRALLKAAALVAVMSFVMSPALAPVAAFAEAIASSTPADTTGAIPVGTLAAGLDDARRRCARSRGRCGQWPVVCGRTRAIPLPHNSGALHLALTMMAAAWLESLETAIVLTRELATRTKGPLPTDVPLYRAGDELFVTASILEGRNAGRCKVLALVPHEWRGPIQYRIQAASEEFQRVVPETDLSPLSVVARN